MADEGTAGAESSGGRGLWTGPAACFALALLVRLGWFLGVQRPGDALYADMYGYVARARDLVGGRDAEVCFPPGAHWFYGAEMAALGPNALPAMGVIHVVLGATIAPMAALLAREALGAGRWATAVGLLVALWYPLVTYGGFFSSELPFAAALTASAWLWVRAWRRGGSGWLAGVCLGAAYLVRPAILPVVPLLWGWALWSRPRMARLVVTFGTPVLLAVALGAARYHANTGRWALIADNGAVASFFAWTDYAGLQTTPPPGMEPDQLGFHPSSRGREDWFDPEFRYVGLRCDPAPLRAERDRVLAASSVGDLAWRLRRNVSFLFGWNVLWPERSEARTGARWWVFRAWPKLQSGVVFPLAALGVAAIFRRREASPERDARIFTALYLLAMVGAAAFYTGEVRYRVPYDALVLVFTVEGARRLVARVTRGGRA